MLVAALVLVVDAWNEIRPEIKLLGLVTCNVAVAVAASAARRRYGAVARVLAHLAATLAVPAGVAAAATGHARWPVAICLGGAVGVVSCVATQDRWRAPWLVPAAEASAVLALAGVAALTNLPLGVLVAALALARLGAALLADDASACAFVTDALSVGSGRSGAARLALVAAAMPSMAMLGRVGIGPGTMVRLGARGEALAWAAPVAGTAAALVLAMVAWRHRSTILLPASLGSLLVGLAMAIPDGVEGGWWWSALPALTVLLCVAMAEAQGADARRGSAADLHPTALEAMGGGPLPLWHRLPVGLRSGVCAALLMAGVAFPVLIGSLLWQRPGSSGAALSLGLWAAALLAAGLPGRLQGWWIPVGLVFRAQALMVLVAFAGAVLGSDVAQVLAAAAVAVVLALLHGFTQTRLTQRPWFGLLAEQVAAVATTLLLLIWLRLRSDLDPAPWVSLTVLGVVTLTVAVGGAVRHRSSEGPSIVGAMRGVSRPETLIDHLVAVLAGLTLALVWPAGSDLVTAIAGLSAGIVVLASGWYRHSVAAVLPALGLALAQYSGLSLEQSLQLCLVVAVALTGVAAVLGRWNPMLSAALAASGTVLVGALEHHPVLASLAGALLGAQLFWCGWHRSWAAVRWFGAALFGLSAASMPVTTGLWPWLVEVLDARGVTDTDLSAGVLTIGMLAAGATLQYRQDRSHTSQDHTDPDHTDPNHTDPNHTDQDHTGQHAVGAWVLSSWATLAPGLVLGGLYVLSTQAARPQDGRLAVGLALGVAAVAAGGRWRLAAPLLLGSALLVAVVVQAAGERLASLPAWSWLAVGGVSLLLVGLSIERRSVRTKPGPGGGDMTGAEFTPPGDRRLLAALCHDLR